MKRGGSRVWLSVYVVAAFVFLLIPIVHVAVFSFNDYRKTNSYWRGFTLDNWLNVCGADRGAVCQSFAVSIGVGLTSTVIATILGTLLAIALGRYRFRGRGSTSLLLFLPMATPEVVLGAGLAAQLLAVGIDKSFWTVVAAHVLFCISFVVVTVKARVASLDPALEEAGRDLYGSSAQVFFRITLPLLTPGIVAAALLSFALSFDDYIITKFNAGTLTTFPLYIAAGAAKRQVPAEANVVATSVFLVAIVIVIVVQVVNAQRAKRLGRTP